MEFLKLPLNIKKEILNMEDRSQIIHDRLMKTIGNVCSVFHDDNNQYYFYENGNFIKCDEKKFFDCLSKKLQTIKIENQSLILLRSDDNSIFTIIETYNFFIKNGKLKIRKNLDFNYLTIDFYENKIKNNICNYNFYGLQLINENNIAIKSGDDIKMIFENYLYLI